MMRRSKAREVALQLLVQHDVNPGVGREVVVEFVRSGCAARPWSRSASPSLTASSPTPPTSTADSPPPPRTGASPAWPSSIATSSASAPTSCSARRRRRPTSPSTRPSSCAALRLGRLAGLRQRSPRPSPPGRGSPRVTHAGPPTFHRPVSASLQRPPRRTRRPARPHHPQRRRLFAGPGRRTGPPCRPRRRRRHRSRRRRRRRRGPAAAVGSGVEVVAGVEITAEHRGRELHLLGYFFAPTTAL